MHKFWAIAVGYALSVGMGVAQENFRKIVPQGRMVQKYQDSEDGPVRVSAGGTRFAEKRSQRVGDTVQPDAEMFLYDFDYIGILESADPEDKTSLLGLESQAGVMLL